MWRNDNFENDEEFIGSRFLDSVMYPSWCYGNPFIVARDDSEVGTILGLVAEETDFRENLEENWHPENNLDNVTDAAIMEGVTGFGGFDALKQFRKVVRVNTPHGNLVIFEGAQKDILEIYNKKAGNYPSGIIDYERIISGALTERYEGLEAILTGVHPVVNARGWKPERLRAAV
jgi:hypothetical protein